VINSRIFAVHGGISPDLERLDQIRDLERPIEIPEYGMLCDLVWADPNTKEDAAPYVTSERGTSVLFSKAPVQEFLTLNNFDMIVRAHQPVMEGYQYPFEPVHTVLTVFSAPNYAGEFGNKGAVLKVAEDLALSFDVLEPFSRVPVAGTRKGVRITARAQSYRF
jgi:serine/threonine-protein phosphatase PP1 catalytic subunit